MPTRAWVQPPPALFAFPVECRDCDGAGRHVSDGYDARGERIDVATRCETCAGYGYVLGAVL